MNALLVIASVLIANAFAARDPSSVCFPPQFQSSVYDFETNDPGVVALDWNRNLLVQSYVQSGRTVYNLTDFSGFNEAPDGVCTEVSAPPEIRSLLTRCLPANSILLSNDTTVIGQPANGVEIEAWEIPLTGIGRARLAFSTTGTPVPILREIIVEGGPSKAIVDVLLFTNQQLSIDDPTMFNRPAVCSPTAAVGK